MGNQEVLLPPPKDQKKIANILSKIDITIQKVDEAKKKAERIKQGLMQRLFMDNNNQE